MGKSRPESLRSSGSSGKDDGEGALLLHARGACAPCAGEHGIEKSECRATEAEGGPASRTKRSLRQGPEMKGTQKQAALKSLKRAEDVRRHAYRRRVRFSVTKEDEKPFSRYEALSAAKLSLEDLSRNLCA